MIEIDTEAADHHEVGPLHRIDPYSAADLADKMPKVRQLPGAEEVLDVHTHGIHDIHGQEKGIELTIELPI